MFIIRKNQTILKQIYFNIKHCRVREFLPVYTLRVSNLKLLYKNTIHGRV